MPFANVRGVKINYETLGNRGPWMALSPGGRRALDAVRSLAQHLAGYGYRVLVHDFAANAQNNPALLEFEFVKDLNDLGKRDDVDLAVVCCPWPEYGSLKFSSATKVFTTWHL